MTASERLLAVIELQNAIAAAAMTADEVIHIVTERAASLTGGTALLAVAEGDEVAYRAVAGAVKLPADMRVARAEMFARACLDDRIPLRVDDVATTEPVVRDRFGKLGVTSFAAVPLLYGEAAVGVLATLGAKPFTDADTDTLRLLGTIVAIALHRAYTYPKPRVDNHFDALTGLANKRAFDERIQAELARNSRYGHSFSLATLKLDGLETASDRFGQAAADEVLRSVATILKTHTRAIDACFRLAADELAIVMPGTSLEGARILVERCRTHIAEVAHCDHTVSPSFGVVAAIEKESADDLLARASASLTADKQQRRKTRTNPPIKT
jgi:diguanylate cyclase (GGDEF)-like protein